MDRELAEGVGFEPTNPCGLAVFKTAALNRSATLPCQPDQALTTGRRTAKRSTWHPIGTRPYLRPIAASIAVAAAASVFLNLWA